MPYRKLAALVLTSLWLAACGANNENPAPLSPIAASPPPPPELPADIRRCTARKYAGEIRGYSESEVARILAAEGNKVERVSACLQRLICTTLSYRVLISKVEGEQLCAVPGKKKG